MPEFSSAGSAGHTDPSNTKIPETASDFDPYLLRVVYLAGFWSARLIFLVHRDWLWAEVDAPFPDVLDQGFSDIRAGISELLAELQGVKLYKSGKSALVALDRAREYIDDRWGGNVHERFIERRCKAEPEGLSSTGWQNRYSILRRRIWFGLKIAIAKFVGNLPTELEMWWTTGSLVAQVAQLRGDNGCQLELLGDEYPIPILQRRLVELKRATRFLQTVDIEIARPRKHFIRPFWSDAIVKTRKLHNKILKQLPRAVGSPLDSSHNEQTQTGASKSKVAKQPLRASDDRNPATQVEPTGTQYVFQLNDRGRWRFKFGDGDLESLDSLDGSLYLHFLVTHVGERFSATELRREKHRFSGGISPSAEQKSEIPHARDIAGAPVANNRIHELAETPRKPHRGSEPSLAIFDFGESKFGHQFQLRKSKPQQCFFERPIFSKFPEAIQAIKPSSAKTPVTKPRRFRQPCSGHPRSRIMRRCKPSRIRRVFRYSRSGMIESPLVADKARTPANRPAGLPPGASAGFFMHWYNAAMIADVFGIPVYVIVLCVVVLLLAIRRFGRPPQARH